VIYAVLALKGYWVNTYELSQGIGRKGKMPKIGYKRCVKLTKKRRKAKAKSK